MFELIESGLILSLALSVMFAVGLDIDVRKLFRSMVLSTPLIRGLVVNLFLLPLFAIVCLGVFNLDINASIGLLLVMICGGGSTGLLFSLHGDADMDFSLTLFMLLNLLSLVLVPIYLLFMIGFFTPEAEAGEPFDFLYAAVMSIVWFQVLPLVVGVIVRGQSITLAARIYPYAKKIANISLISLFVGFSIVKGQLVLELPMQLIIALILVVVGTCIAGVLSQSPKNAVGRSILFITMVRNLTLALLINDRVFGDENITLVVLTYGLFMYIVCGVLLIVLRRSVNIVPV